MLVKVKQIMRVLIICKLLIVNNRFKLERKKGLEPSTSSLATKCSTIELLPQVI